MSFTSIRCPNCAGSESLIVGENQYQCKFCDNVFHHDNPDTPKITKNITVQESNHCPICGRGVTLGTSNRCTMCKVSDFCSNCVDETMEKKLICRNCLPASLKASCMECGKYSLYTCYSCVKLHEKNNSHIITAICAEHFTPLPEKKHAIKASIDICPDCGVTCNNCTIKESKWNRKKICKNCHNDLVSSNVFDPLVLKNQNQNFITWINQIK